MTEETTVARNSGKPGDLVVLIGLGLGVALLLTILVVAICMAATT